jgi:hypothetical protein
VRHRNVLQEIVTRARASSRGYGRLELSDRRGLVEGGAVPFRCDGVAGEEFCAKEPSDIGVFLSFVTGSPVPIWPLVDPTETSVAHRGCDAAFADNPIFGAMCGGRNDCRRIDARRRGKIPSCR